MVTCGPTLAELLMDGKIFDAVVCPHSEALGGMVVFALVVYGSIMTGLYVFSGTAVLPLSLTIILGGVIVSQLPGPAVQFAGVVLLLILAAGGYFLVTSRGPASA